jgi:rubrerythrin
MMAEKEERGLGVLCAALELEKGENEFYKKAAESCPNEVGREIFRMLAGDEVEHARQIEEIYKMMQAGKPWPEQCALYDREQRDAKGVLQEVASRHGAVIEAGAGALEALDVAVDLERSSVRFYKDQLDHATDPRERKFLEKMIEEEQGHFLILSDMRYYYSDPEGYFMEKEHRGLDGA